MKTQIDLQNLEIEGLILSSLKEESLNQAQLACIVQKDHLNMPYWYALKLVVIQVHKLIVSNVIKINWIKNSGGHEVGFLVIV